MFFVLSEDSVLHVSDSETELQGAFEGIDVEDGVYRFFDEFGTPLVAEFATPNQRGKQLGLVRWVISGTYLLRPAQDVTLPHLAELLGPALAVHTNPHFPDVDAVLRWLTR
jgi:hypothetical protein